MKSIKYEDAKSIVDALEGVEVNAFAELTNALNKIPGIISFSINPEEGDRASLATSAYLATLFEGDSCKSQPITLHVRHYPKFQGEFDYSIGTTCGTIWFEIAHGNFADMLSASPA